MAQSQMCHGFAGMHSHPGTLEKQHLPAPHKNIGGCGGCSSGAEVQSGLAEWLRGVTTRSTHHINVTGCPCSPQARPSFQTCRLSMCLSDKAIVFHMNHKGGTYLSRRSQPTVPSASPGQKRMPLWDRMHWPLNGSTPCCMHFAVAPDHCNTSAGLPTLSSYWWHHTGQKGFGFYSTMTFPRQEWLPVTVDRPFTHLQYRCK